MASFKDPMVRYGELIEEFKAVNDSFQNIIRETDYFMEENFSNALATIHGGGTKEGRSNDNDSENL